MFVLPDVSQIVALSLAEDLGVPAARFLAGAPESALVLARDVTTFSAIGLDAHFAGRVVARQDAVVCGLPVVAAVFDALSAATGLFDEVEVFPLVAEGSHVSAGTAVLEVEGVAAVVLAAERSALDFLMLLSGIATETARWVSAAGPSLAVCDTRKTWPGMRALSKYAVAVGGGTNHRVGLYDMVLVKDNHVRRAGGITAAVAAARELQPELLVEVEADTLAQAQEAASAGVDLILLDNMSDAQVTEAVRAVRDIAVRSERSIATEASGTIDLPRLATLRTTGVDRVSSSALTLRAMPVDFGLDER